MKNLLIRTSKNLSDYQNLMNRIGIAMLSLIAAMFSIKGIVYLFGSAVMFWDLPQNDQEIIYEFIDAIGYMCMFLVPIFVFRIISKNKGFSEIRFNFRFTLDLIPIIFCALAISRVAATINSYYFLSAGDIVLPIKPEAENLWVNILSIALVPAVCEELLFRGIVLENLRPYGKITAIISSSVLFGLMHTNSYQFFYTTIAGILLGIIYLKTESVFAPMVFHFVNNALFVIDEFVLRTASEDVSYIYSSASMLTIIIIGIISMLAILKKGKKKGQNFLFCSYFEKSLPEGRFYEDVSLSAPSLISGFFAPTNLAFVCIAIGIGFFYW